MNIGLFLHFGYHKKYEHLYTSIYVDICFHSFVSKHRSGIAGSHGNSLFNRLRSCQTVFKAAALLLQSRQHERDLGLS